MSDVIAGLQQVEASDAFRKLTGPKQFEYRSRYLKSRLARNPQYTSLPPDKQVEYIKRLTFRPPVMETPEGIGRVGEAQRRLAAFTASEKTTREGTPGEQLRALPGLFEGNWESVASTLQGMEKESVVFGLRRTVARWAPGFAYQVVKGILGDNHPHTQSVKRMAEWTPAHFRDQDKWEAWVDATLSEGKQYRSLNHNLTKGASKLFMNIGELYVASELSGAALGFSAMGGAATTRLGSALGKGLKFTKFGVDTGTEFARQMVLSWEQDPERKYTLDQMVGTFGQTVAWNIIGVTAGKALSTMALPLKNVFGGYGKRARGATFEDFVQAHDDLFSGKAVDPQMFANLGAQEQRALRVWENAVNVAKNVKKRTPENMLGVVAGINGYELSVLPDGRSLLMPFVEGLQPRSFKSFQAVEKWFAGEVAANVARTADETATMLADSKNLRLEFGSDWVNSLARKRFGSSLEKVPDGWMTVVRTDEGDLVPKTFKDLREAGSFMLTGGVNKGHIDASLAPDGAVIVEGTKALRYTDTVAMGSRRDLYNHLAAYRDDAVYKAREVVFKTGDQEVSKSLNHYEIVDDVTGLRAEFTNTDSMLAWLKTGEDDLLKARDIAARRGYRLEPYAGRWYAYASDGQPLQFDTVADALKGLETVRVPEYAPELTGIDSRLAATMGPKVDLVDHVWNERDVVKDLSNMTYNFRTADTVVEKAVLKLGAPETLAKDFAQVITAREAHEAYRSLGYGVIHQAFSPAGGRMISRAKAADLHLVLTQETRAKAAAMLEKLNKGRRKPIGDEALEVWDRVNSFRGKEGRGLAGFGQIGERMAEGSYVLGYVPELTEKIKNYIASNPRKHFMGDPMRVLTEAGVNEKYLPFFRHARMDDIVDLGKVADPITAFERVYDIIAREKFLAPALDRLEKGVDKAAKDGSLNSNLAAYLTDFVNVAYGRVKEADYKTLKSDLARKVAKPFAALGLVPKETASFIDLAMNLSYSSSLGFRPYPVVRNMVSQPLMLIGPVMGFDYLGRAMKTLGRPGEMLPLVDKLRRNGTLLGEGHVNLGTELSVSKGLGGIRRSDDYTRALAWLTTKYRFDEAKDLLVAGKFKGADPTGEFLKRSGLAKMSTDVQKAALEHIKAGQWDAAHDLYARRFAFETLFPFANAYNPRYLKKEGVIGRLFGQFGTFSGWYVDALARYGFERGDWMDKVGFAARLAAGTGIASAAAAAMGLKWARDWAPWGPAMFSGGPYFDLVTTSLDLMKPGYPGRQARAEMFGITEEGGVPKIDPLKAWNAQASRLLIPLPGRVQIDYFTKTAKYIEQGETYKAILSALSAPVDPKYDH